jgi:ubiquinone/menaquinone biosynthesis C-methylase UbiE
LEYQLIVIQPKDPQVLWAMADLPVSGALLDAGGGTGRVAQFMSGKAHPIFVVDLSYKMLSVAREKDGLNPVCSHTECLPYPDASFERIIMVDALHHVCDQRQTVDELWRVLKPGGRLVIEEPDVRSFTVKLIAIGEKLALMRSHFLAPQRIVDLFHYPNAEVRMETRNYNAYIIAKKNFP